MPTSKAVELESRQSSEPDTESPARTNGNAAMKRQALG
jgi:hypothetical protein